MIEEEETMNEEQTEVKEQLKMKLDDAEVLQIVQANIERAKKAKTDIETKQKRWKQLYNAETDQTVSGRSKFVSKDAKKNLHWFIPNAMKPFMTTDDIVEAIPRTADDVQRAKSQATLLNFQFNNEFDKYDFLWQSLFVMGSEGTVVARTGWDFEEEPEHIPFKGTYEQYQTLLNDGAKFIGTPEAERVQVPQPNPLDPLGNPILVEVVVVTGTIEVMKTVKSRPTAAIIRNENFYIDPDATTIDSAEFTGERIEITLSDLREQEKTDENPNGIYKNIDEVKEELSKPDSTLGLQREQERREHGSNQDEQSSDPSMKKIEIIEYYGKIDVDQDGIAENVVVTYAGNIVIRLEANPFPDKKPPYVAVPYSPAPFSFWGDAMAAFVEDVQQVKTAIMRTFIDTMAHSTNGIKHTLKNALDPLNKRKLRISKIGDVIEWNDAQGLGAYQRETKNDIPTSMLKMLELFTAEGENESGITRYNQGLDARSLNKTATGISAIMNQSQMRIWETTSRFAEEYIKKLFRKWIAYNQEFLSDEVAVRIAGNRFENILPDDIGGNYDLSINVAIAGSNQEKAMNIVQLMQMSPQLVQSGIVPADHLADLLASLEELWQFKDLSSDLRDIADGMKEKRLAAAQNPQQPPDGSLDPNGNPIQ